METLTERRREGNANGKRSQKLVCYLMKNKLEDEERNVGQARRECNPKNGECGGEIREGRVDEVFTIVLRREKEKIWIERKEGKGRKREKMETLTRRRREENDVR